MPLRRSVRFPKAWQYVSPLTRLAQAFAESYIASGGFFHATWMSSSFSQCKDMQVCQDA